MDSYWEKVQEGLIAAVEMSAADFEIWLEKFCQGDEKLKAEIESFLPLDPNVDNFLEKGIGNHAAKIFLEENVFAEEKSLINKTFGHYQIIREIGHGGMGAVFLADRIDGEFEQQVAIKIVRQTIADRSTIQRFKRERQILASLNHPNIAKLLDGGVSPNGEPFLAMEYVEGEAITDFVENQKLSLEERLKLFQKVCAAVTYAHRNLTVHRDIKPSNILVTKDGEPKLLDFGLAKLVDENLSNDGEQTQTAFRILTPAYASPEQLKGEAITTASDIYSLGIVLYELLIGERPFQFEGKNLEEIIKTVTENEPPPPSAIVHPKSEKDAKNPKSKIQNPKLKGDLDNIVLMALRKEPERRYQSVEQFAEDIERHRTGLPVFARPNTFKYRATKFINRHKIGVLTVSLILLSLIGGVVVSLWQARVAQREKEKADTVNNFLQSILEYSSPNMNSPTVKSTGMSIKDVLDEASKRLENEDLLNQPEVRAELQRIIGTSYLSQGEYDSAERNLLSALEIQNRIYGENSAESLKTLVALGELFVNKYDKENAEKFYRQRLSILRSEQKRGNISVDYLLAALTDFAVLRRSQGYSSEAEKILSEALNLRKQISSSAQNGLGIAEAIYALTLADQGKFDEAIAIVSPKVEALKKQPNLETPEFASNLTALGSFQLEKGDLGEAEKNLVESERIYRKLFNPAYLPIGDNLRLQAQLFYNKDNFAESEKKINEALRIYQQSSKPQYTNYPTALIIKGLILNQKNNHAEAEKVLREALKLRTDSLPKEHFWVSLAQSALGECLTTQKKFAEAEPLLRESYENLKISQGENTPRTLLAYSRLTKFEEESKK